MIRCPKCKCKRLLIEEHGCVITQHEWDGCRCTGHNSDVGSYEKVFAKCEQCGHHWRLRGRVQWWCEEEEMAAAEEMGSRQLQQATAPSRPLPSIGEAPTAA